MTGTQSNPMGIKPVPIRSPFCGPRVRLLPASNLWMGTSEVSSLETSNFAQGQGNQRIAHQLSLGSRSKEQIARRRTNCTPHKKSGRLFTSDCLVRDPKNGLTPKLRKRAVSGQKLNYASRSEQARMIA
jgi:hypothetical protein